MAGAKGVSVWTKLEALRFRRDFIPGVLTARRQLEGGIRFGLGSTLATTKTVLAKIGGLEGLVESLADDYEMGARIAAAGLRVELSDEVVETTVPRLMDFADSGSTRYGGRGRRWDSRRWGYVGEGMGVTYADALGGGDGAWPVGLNFGVFHC